MELTIVHMLCKVKNFYYCTLPNFQNKVSAIFIGSFTLPKTNNLFLDLKRLGDTHIMDFLYRYIGFSGKTKLFGLCIYHNKHLKQKVNIHVSYCIYHLKKNRVNGKLLIHDRNWLGGV